MTTSKQQKQTNAINELRELLSAGDYVYYRRVKSTTSGWHVAFYVMKDNQPVSISGLLSTALGYRLVKSGAISIGGIGAHPANTVVYRLSRELFNDPYSLKYTTL